MKTRVRCLVLGLLLCGQVAWGADRVKLELAGEWPLTGTGFAGDVEVLVDIAYVLEVVDIPSRNTVLQVVDISHPAQPVLLGDCEMFAWEGHTREHLAALDGFVYRSGSITLEIYDASNPTDPHRVGTVEGIGGQLAVASGIACVLLDSELLVIDTSESESPHVVGTYNSAEVKFYDVAVSRNTAYLTGQVRPEGSDVGVLDILDLSDPTRPALATRHITGGQVQWCRVQSNYACLSHQRINHDGSHSTGLLVIDVSNPESPHELGICHTPSEYMHPFSLRTDYAFVPGAHFSWSGLYVIDISDPLNPTQVAALSEPSGDLTHGATEQVVVWSAGEMGLRIYSITELPAITRQSVAANMLNLQWNEPAKGMKLQRATSLMNPDWKELQGSEAIDNVELPTEGGQEFFRLVEP